MYNSSRITRTLTTLGGGAVVSLALCFPAGAADGDGAPAGVDVGAAKHGGIEAPASTQPSPPVDVGAAKHGGIESPERVDVGRMLNDIDSPATRPGQPPSPAPVQAAAQTSGPEYDQILLGALGGVTLAGATVLVLRRRGGHHSPRLV